MGNLNQTAIIAEETAEQKAARHARKEAKLQGQINGNSVYRGILIEGILTDFKKFKNFKGHEDDVRRLLNAPESYLNCEMLYNRLILIIKSNGTAEMQVQAEKFENELPAMLKKAKRFSKA